MRAKAMLWGVLGWSLVMAGCQFPLTPKSQGFQLTLNFSSPSLRGSDTTSRLLLPTAAKVALTVASDGKTVDAQTVSTAGKPSVTFTLNLPPLATYDIKAEARTAAGVLVFAGSTSVKLVGNVTGTLNLLPVDASGSLSVWPVVKATDQAVASSVTQGLTLAAGKSTSFLVDFAGAGSAFTFTPLVGDLELYVQLVDTAGPVSVPANRTVGQVASGLWVTYYAPTVARSLTTLGRFSIPVQSVTTDTTLTLGVGGTKVLSFGVTPANADAQSLADFTWTSADPTVASVDASGQVTALKVGSTSITVASKLVPTVSDTVPVTVNTSAIAVTGVSLTAPTGPLAPGATTTLTATVLPSTATVQTVSWTSSQPSVATVDPTTGLITAVAVGTTVITVTTTDGAKTATASVVVTGSTGLQLAITGAQSLAFDKTTVTIDEGTALVVTTTNPTLATSGTGWTWQADATPLPSALTGSQVTVDTTSLPPGVYSLDVFVTYNGVLYSSTVVLTIQQKVTL